MTELEVLADVARRLDSIQAGYMLTGSFAMNLYAEPRMTRDLDLVVALTDSSAERIEAAFSPDYYVSGDAVREAYRNQTSFNLIHNASVLKIDCMIRKNSPHRIEEFGRRRKLSLDIGELWVVSIEDLIIAKLDWARESRSERQLGDVRNLLASPHDGEYVRRWVVELELTELYNAAAHE